MKIHRNIYQDAVLKRDEMYHESRVEMQIWMSLQILTNDYFCLRNIF